MNNKENQALLLPEISFMLNHMGKTLNVNDTISAIFRVENSFGFLIPLQDNYALISSIDQFFIGYMVKLLAQKRKGKYLYLLDVIRQTCAADSLQTIVEAENHQAKDNQTTVINLLMKDKDKLLSHASSLKVKK
jgi:hypothetical protein